jgi:hypothetical protein
MFYAMVRQSGVPIRCDDRDTPDMSEVSADRPSWPSDDPLATTN